jgi:NADH-ubiquinone oxidoreductase chain 1
VGVVGLNFIWCSSYSAVYLFRVLSLGVYFVLLCGWGSSSRYALLGSYRGVSQTASYEVCLVLFALTVCYYSERYNVCLFFFIQEGCWFVLWGVLYTLFWLIVCLAERNRSPFDFSEGESELVSGFNVEYGGVLFSLIFINEYGRILLLGGITSYLVLGRSFLVIKCLLISLMFVVVRGSYPRYRYDVLIRFSWKFLLPFSLSFICGVVLLC